ncbi:hypothetical protein ACFPL7_05735 [Dongia soli]|uniref:Uncharacterized protein n=1 Tax=Dongia soli TaxID=600628 RepID=A0ABU5EG72_9PROT|nr:hypothetical protein [Dongia soli]MDY0884902.1 hypothetical protein [Dongia soli]
MIQLRPCSGREVVGLSLQHAPRAGDVALSGELPDDRVKHWVL